MKVGDVLKDAIMTIHMWQKGHEMGTMTMTIHRKVEGKENVTVPAGIFDSYKMAMEMESEMNMMGMKRPLGKTQTTEWFAVGTGPVKSETYKDGKIIRYSVLSKMTK